MKAVLLALVLTSIQAAFQSKPDPDECPCSIGTEALDCSNLEWRQIPDFELWLGSCANTLKHISLSHNKLTDMPFVMSAKEFKQHAPRMEIKNGIYFANRLPLLDSIDLSHNRIKSKEANHELAMYLSSSNIMHMNISHNRVTDMNSVGSLQYGDIAQILSPDIFVLDLEYNSIRSLPSFKQEHKLEGALLLNGNPLAVDMNGHVHNQELLNGNPLAVDMNGHLLNQEFLLGDIVSVCWPYSVTEKEEYLARHAVMSDKEQYVNRFPKEIKNIIGEEYSGLPNGASFVSWLIPTLVGTQKQRAGFPFLGNCHPINREKKKDPINREKKKGLRKGCCDRVSSLFYL